MTLPKLDNPIYEITLPISKKKYTFRPFLVKEQKILLLAMESEDADFMINNLRQIIKNCCVNAKDIDIDTLCSIDVDFIFLNLRARSVGETIETHYRCKIKNADGDECDNLMDVKLDLLTVGVDLEDYNDMIQISGKVGIKLKYPDLNVIKALTSDSNDVIGKSFNAIYHSIEYIYDDNNFYYPSEVPKTEIFDFLESLSIEQFKKIENFFQNLPKIKKDIEAICSKCGSKHNIHLEGIENFLG